MGDISFHGRNNNMRTCCFSYLVVQVPGLVVFLCAFSAINRLVVYLDELPFRTVAEVSKKSANDTVTLNHKQQAYDNI